MTIGKDTTLADVVLATIADYEPTETDLDVWTELEGASTNITTKTGLAGFDLTDFLANCAKATENCDVADYEKYNGWARGIEWTASAEPGSADTVVFEDTKVLVYVMWGYGALSGEVTADDVPEDFLDGDFTFKQEGPDETPFDGAWTGEATSVDEEFIAYAISFQKEDDDPYYDYEVTTTVWNHSNFSDGEATEVTWNGAAQLSAAAGAIIAALLF